MTNSSEVSLEGLMGLVKKSKILLAPLFESITNSMESIAMNNISGGFSPEINITFHFTGLLNETKELNAIYIEDNGIGFNEDSFERYKRLLDKSKGFRFFNQSH